MNITTAPGWDVARAHWAASVRHLAAALRDRVQAGLALRALKGDRSIREFLVEANEQLRGLPGVSRATIGRALQLAEHADLIEQHQPDSENAALRLIRDHARPCLTLRQQNTRELPAVSHAAAAPVSRPSPAVSHAALPAVSRRESREATDAERELFALEWIQAGVAFAPDDLAAQSFFDNAVVQLNNRCPWDESQSLLSFLLETEYSEEDEDHPGSYWLWLTWPYPIRSRDPNLNGENAEFERCVYVDAELVDAATTGIKED